MEKLIVKGDPPIPCTAKSVVSKLVCRTADFVGLYTATGGAEFGPPPLAGPCGPPRTL